MKLKLLSLSFWLLLSLACVDAAFAQSSTGTLSGTVLDGHQRPIYNAQITVIQNETQRTLKTVTTRAGVFSFPGLDAGTYSIFVAATGFNTEQQTGVNIDPAGSSTQDFNLKPGGENSSITVYATGDMIQRDNSAVGNSVSQDLLENLPLPDHSALGLVTLIPGVTGDPQFSQGVQSENPGIFTNPTIPGASLSLGGSRPGLASQLIDGFDITQSGYPRAGVSFTPFAIKQVTVQMAGMSAEFGRTGGGIINQASAEGGAKYHGTLVYRHSDPGLGQAYRTGSNQPSDHHQTLYGGAISGPVGIPHGPKLKNTFFLFSWEPLRQRDVQFSRIRLETPDELNGQFMGQNPTGTAPTGTISLEMLNTTTLRTQGYGAAADEARRLFKNPVTAPAGTRPINQLYYQYPLSDPNGKITCPGNGLFPCGQKLPVAGTGVTPIFNKQQTPILNDDLSAQVALNPLAQFIRAHYPTPTNPGKYVNFDNLAASYDSVGNNAFAARGVVNHDDRWGIRVDHTFRNNDHLFARYTVVPVSGVRYGFLGPDNPLNNIATDETTSRNYALNYVHLFGPRIVNEFRVSYIRGFRYRIPPPASRTQDFGASLGLAPATVGVGFPTIAFDNTVAGVGGGGGFQDGGRSLDEGYGYGNETTIVFGRHQLKFGAEFRALQLNRTDVSNNYGGTYNFASNTISGGGGTGSSIAALDLGLVNLFTTAGTQPFYYRWKYVAGFIQDTWKARPNLTLNYGLRYNLEYPRSEAYNNQGSFSPTATGTLNGLPVTGGLVHSGTYGMGKYVYPVNYMGFEPRFGISFAPRSWVVIKSAFALIHAPLTGVGNTILPAFPAAAEQVGINNGGVLNAMPTPAGGTPYTASALDFISNPAVPIARVGANLNNPLFSYTTALLPFVDQIKAVPYVEIWNLGATFAIGKRSTVDATYVGQRAIHLYSPALGTNLPDQAKAAAMQQAHANFNAVITNPYGFGGESVLQSLVPYQQFYNNPIIQAYNRHSQSSYHGLYLSGRVQVLKHLSLLGGFSWSKSMDTNSNPSVDGTSIDAFGLAGPQNPYTLAGDYSVSAFDQPARTTLGYNYDLPFGRGQQFFASHRILNVFIGGWATSGYYSAQSGYPLSVGEGNNAFFLSTPTTGSQANILGANGATQLYAHIRPNRIPGVPLMNANWKNDKLGAKTGLGILNQNAFAAPGSLDNPSYGNVARELSGARNPRSQNWDASLRKSLQVSDRFRLLLNCDVQNAANHPNYFDTLVPNGVFTGALNPAGYTAQGPFAQSLNFSVPNAFSATRIINVGAQLSF